MNKNFKVITINGIRGIFALIFIVFGIIAGFVVSPGWVCMELWNFIFKDSYSVAQMNIYQGIMLWAIIALSLYALNNRRPLIGFGSYQGLSPEQIKDIMERAKQAETKFLRELDDEKRAEIKNIILNRNSKFIKNSENSTLQASNGLRKEENIIPSLNNNNDAQDNNIIAGTSAENGEKKEEVRK